MAHTQRARERADFFGNIDDWMAARWGDIEHAGSEAEEAGRRAWDWATRTGHNLIAARPRDVVALGGRILRGQPVTTSPRIVEDAGPLREIQEPVEPGAAPDTGEPDAMDLGLRFSAAKAGDSISKLVGSSDPRAIGKFLSLNGMDGRTSTLREGQSYVVPTRWDDATSDESAAGRTVLGVDNTRLKALAAKRADEAARRAETARTWAEPWVEPSPSPGPWLRGLADPRAFWTDDRTKLSATPLQQSKARQRSWIDNSLPAKAAVGTLAYEAGLIPGVVRAGVHGVEGAAETGNLLWRLSNPLDRFMSPPGQSAQEQVFRAGQAIGAYADTRIKNPALFHRDFADAVHDIRLKYDPTATPIADTIGEEARYGFGLGKNHGELGANVAALALGGEGVGAATGITTAAKAADAVELAALANNPGLSAYLDLPYKGIGHHTILPRRAKLPSVLGGGAYPDWILESPFNKIQTRNMTNRDFYRNHVGVDDFYHGGRVPKRYGGGGWSAKKDLGWTKHGPLDRIRYGTAPATKYVVGGQGAASSTAGWLPGNTQ